MIYFVIAVVVFIIFAVIMAFVSDFNGWVWLLVSCLSIILLFVSVLVYSYNKKYDLKITDVNGQTYEYKSVNGLTYSKNGTTSFKDKNGNWFSYRVAVLQQEESK